MRPVLAVIAAGALAALAGCADEAGSTVSAAATPNSSLADYALDESPDAKWKLPDRLREISGLATTADGRVFAHNDERGVVYELELAHKRIVKSFRLGSKAVRDDFEGIAVAEGTVFLVASDGTLYAASEGADDTSVDFTTWDTRIGDRCEVEGLEYEPATRSLLLACKTTRGSDPKNAITIYRWSTESQETSEEPVIRISKRDLRPLLQQEDFHPSGIARDPATGNYFLVSARERTILEISTSGTLVAAAALERGRHQHAEGIAFGPDEDGTLSLWISDEGSDRRARLTRYRARAPGRPDEAGPTAPD